MSGNTTWLSTANVRTFIDLTDDSGKLVHRCTTDEWLNGIHEFTLEARDGK